MRAKARLIAGAFLVSVVVSLSIVFFCTGRQTAASAGRHTKVLIPVDSLSLAAEGRRRGGLKGAESLPISDRIVLRDLRDVGNLRGKQWADRRKRKEPIWKDPNKIKNGLDLDLSVDQDDTWNSHIKAMAIAEVNRKAHSAVQVTDDLLERARANGWKVAGGGAKSKTGLSHHHKSQKNPQGRPAELPPETYGLIPGESDWLAGRCRDGLCSEFLSNTDVKHFLKCRNVSQSPLTADANPQCHFMDGRNRDPVGLVSFPGSGNTWVRGLLEKVTGVCTGAIYCDRALRYQGFVGEYIVSGSVLVVKSHVHTYQWKGEVLEYLHQGVQSVPALFGSAIFLVRNLFDVLVSERKRLIGLMELGNTTWPPPPGKLDDSHTNSINESCFGSNPEWDKFIHTHSKSWATQIKKWVLHPVGRKKVMVVRYEDLLTDKLTEVKRMLQFLEFPFTEDSLRARLQDDFDLFHRRRDTFDHYTEEQRQYMNNVLREMDMTLQEANMAEVFRLQDYMYTSN